jgi:hypothetical protein
MHLVETNQNHSQRRVWFAYAMLLLMNMIDLVYTNAILTIGSIEANPIMNFIYEHYGIKGIAGVKFVCLGMLSLGLVYLPVLHPFYRRIFYLSVMVYGALSLYHGYWFFGLHQLF